MRPSIAGFDHDTDLAWQRLARQRLGIGTALFDVPNGPPYAVDMGAQIFLYRVIAARACSGI